MKRVLFVDDDPRELQRYLEMFPDKHGEWELVTAGSGHDAIRLMFDQPADVVVADEEMPGMQGSELLDLVMQRYPRTVRLICCNPERIDANLRLPGRAHQELHKPASREPLESAIDRPLALRGLLTQRRLQALVSQVAALPSMPDRYLELLEELNTPEPDVERIGQVIQRDPAMCAKLLQVVNSAFFGLPTQITHPSEATAYVGIETIKALVLSLQFFAHFERVRLPDFSFQTLWSHSWATGLLARALARAENSPAAVINLSFTAGLLHDAGKLILASGLPDPYQAVLHRQVQSRLPLWELERDTLGASHAEVGAYLLALWGLPDPLVEAIAFHHRPVDSMQLELGPIAFVHTADILNHELLNPNANLATLETPYLQAIGIEHRLDTWRRIARDLAPS